VQKPAPGEQTQTAQSSSAYPGSLGQGADQHERAPTLSDERRALALAPNQLLVDGKWRSAKSGRRFAVQDPATGEVVAEVADAGPEDGLDALAAASGAQAGWASTAPRRRSDILRTAYELMTARSEDLALLMTIEMGKPLAESRAEVAYAAEFFRWFSEQAVRVAGDYRVAPGGAHRLLLMRQPVGPCLLITPWNFPAAMAARKLAPALAAGCTAVLKPAEQTPLSSLAIAQILVEAGLPAGVVNVVETSAPGELTAPLIRDRRLRKLSFTGSTEVGSALMAAAAHRVLRVSLELGGNAPFIVFADANLEHAIEGALLAKMRNTGEACTAANRFYVQERLADEFAERLAASMHALPLGRGTEPGVKVGPLIDAAQREKVAALVDDAVSRGAKVLCGGAAPARPGYFFEPTVLAGVPNEAELTTTEIFGPVAPVQSFGSEDEALELANSSDFGLVSYVYTRDLDRALRVAEGLESGMVGLNRGMVSDPAAPFGGVKLSGLGREGGEIGIEEYLELKYVSVAKNW
jgi:succinate-semialdehyde dehydrogenase/glutarate-semialdehyde dehydrogenase